MTPQREEAARQLRLAQALAIVAAVLAWAEGQKSLGSP